MKGVGLHISTPAHLIPRLSGAAHRRPTPATCTKSTPNVSSSLLTRKNATSRLLPPAFQPPPFLSLPPPSPSLSPPRYKTQQHHRQTNRTQHVHTHAHVSRSKTHQAEPDLARRINDNGFSPSFTDQEALGEGKVADERQRVRGGL